MNTQRMYNGELTYNAGIPGGVLQVTAQKFALVVALAGYDATPDTTLW
jgi:hypothetical protein